MTGELRMNSYARRHTTPRERASIERSIPEGHVLSVVAGNGVGDWSVRLYDPAGALLIVTRNHRTIMGGATTALAKFTAAARHPQTSRLLTVSVHRSMSPFGINARLTRCRRGHEFTGIWRGRRTCRTCTADRQRQHRARRAAAA